MKDEQPQESSEKESPRGSGIINAANKINKKLQVPGNNKYLNKIVSHVSPVPTKIPTSTQDAAKLALQLASNAIPPEVKIIIAAVILAFIIIIGLLIFIFGRGKGGGSTVDSRFDLPPSQHEVPGSNPNISPVPGLNLSKTGPGSIQNGQNITYNLSIVNTQDNDAVIYDTVPHSSTFVNATGIYTLSNNNISWKLKDNTTTGITKGSFTFTLTVKPNDDSLIENQAWAEAAAPSSSQPPSNGTTEPTKDNCNGKYNLLSSNEFGLNFGDPSCNFTKDALYALLKQKDPTYADVWFITVISCESGYDPNNVTFSVGGVHTPDAGGAWGLYQMAGKGSTQGNGQYDMGEVPWQDQTTNAIAYNNALIKNGNQFRYWQCASGLWPGNQQ